MIPDQPQRDFMKLSAENVTFVFDECYDRLYLPESLWVETFCKMAFFREPLEKHRLDIIDLLSQLPDEFHQHTGGGTSFLYACTDRDGNQWGEHVHINMLLSLGMAIGRAKFLMAKEYWDALPGGMPYFVVTYD